MRKRQQKKNGQSCPICKGKDGISGRFTKGKQTKYVFLWCNDCDYDIIRKMIDIKSKV